MKLPAVAIVGRPNVGKSTLFNRFVGSRQALVDDRPGVTRDRNYGMATWDERELVVIDTGGLDPEPGDDLFDAIRAQATAAVEEADVVLFLVDQQLGLTPADRVAAELMRKAASDKLMLVVNKCDGPRQELEATEFYELGIEPVQFVSAAHGRNIYELIELVKSRLPETGAVGGPVADEDEIRVAVIGRPNIGKSTLVNRLIGEERHVVHDAPGTTMDAVDSVIQVNGRTWRIVDTAGVRRKARIDDRLETFATARAIRTIERCHVTLLMIDATQGVTGQDARLASLVVDRGRAAVLLLNKWDQVKVDPDRNVKVVKEEIAQSLPHMAWAPELYISALTGKGCSRILPLVEKAYNEFDKRIPTSDLNRFLEEALLAHSPPQKNSNPVRLNYMTQVRVRPPTFTVWSNSPDAIQESYKRFLHNRLREVYGFEGTPLRLSFKKKRKPGEAASEEVW